MKRILSYFSLLFLCLFVTNAQSKYYNNGDTSTQKKHVGAMWLSGTIVLLDGTELKGDVRGSSYTGDDIRSFRYRSEKGEKSVYYKAKDCKLVQYDGLTVLSLPKNLKKNSGKRKFYVALYYGKHMSVLQNPKAEIANGEAGKITFNNDQMLSYLILKDNEMNKITKLFFRKKMKKIVGDNKQFMERSSDKKWFNYDNLYNLAHFYNQTK
ncbi:MAG: hypothetical protein ACPHXR_01805 [Flavicella sp.]